MSETPTDDGGPAAPRVGSTERAACWAFLFLGAGIVLAWALLIAVAQRGDRRLWCAATAGLALFGLLAGLRPVWALYACLLLTGVNLKLLSGWRDPLDGLYRPVEAAQLFALGQRINMDSMQASILLVVACVVLFARRRVAEPLRRMALPFAAFFVVLGASWLLNGARLYGLKTAASLVTPILFGAAVYAAIEPRRDALRLEKVFYSCIVLSVAAGAAGQLLWSKPLLALSHGQLRFSAGTSPPLFCMACSVPLGLAYSRALREDWRAWALVGAILLLIGTTLTRAHVGTAMVVLAGGAVLAPRRKLRSFLLAVLLVLVVAFVFWEPLQKRTFGPAKLPGYLARFFAPGSEAQRELERTARLDTSGRKDVWRAYWRLAGQRPVLGHGPGSAYRLGGTFDFTEMRTPHNAYLQLLVEGGVLGLLAYLGGIVCLLVQVLRARGGPAPGALWADAGLFCLAYLLLLGSVANILYVQSFPAAVLAVVAVALRGAAGDSTGEQPGVEPT